MKTYLIRWRGRIEGPFSLEQIDSRLDTGQLGLLTEIQVDGQWITLRDFYGSRPAEAQIAVGQSSAPAPERATVIQSDVAAFPPPLELEDRSKPATKKWIALASSGVIVFCLLVGYFAFTSRSTRFNRRKQPPPSVATRASTNVISRTASLPPQTNAVALPILSTNANVTSAPIASNAPIVTSVAAASKPAQGVVASNISQTAIPPSLPPLPENEPRLFHLKNNTNYFGNIIHVDRKGLIIKLTSGQYTSRLPWDLFDEEALAREPKVLAFKKAQEAARLAAERARVAAAEAAEKARVEKAEAERRLEEYRNQQDSVIDASIRKYGWKTVTQGYLKAWGNQVSIGEIFSVVAPSARWSAGKLADYESERYTHYLVEAKWTNDNGEPVAMQYLVTADGSDFRLHGCFVSGSKMTDLPFLVAVKQIWERKH